MISSLCWVPKGSASIEPKYLDTDVLKPPTALGGEQALDAHDAGDEDIVDDHMEEEDGESNDNADDNGEMDEVESEEEPDVISMVGMKGLVFHKDGEEDPYVTLPDDTEEAEEMEDLRIREHDNVLVTASHEEELSQLEVYVYDEEQGSMYVHHDILLPAFPLAVEWMDFNVHDPLNSRGNYVAVGSFLPGIEVWDMDVVNATHPVVTLGGYDLAKPESSGDYEGLTAKQRRNKKKKDKKKQMKGGGGQLVLKEGSHSDAVLTLGWNKQQRNVLASGSADLSVKLWDLSTAQCVYTQTGTKDKVQAIQWNPQCSQVLATGCFGGHVSLLDGRSNNVTTSNVSLNSDVEALTWHPVESHLLCVSCESGMVYCLDTRKFGSASTLEDACAWQLAAHTKACSHVSFNPIFPDVLVTSSLDKTAKLWSCTGGQEPSLVASQSFDCGPIFSAQWAPNQPHLVGIGGNHGDLRIWNIKESKTTRDWFSNLVNRTLDQ